MRKNENENRVASLAPGEPSFHPRDRYSTPLFALQLSLGLRRPAGSLRKWRRRREHPVTSLAGELSGAGRSRD